MKVNGLKCLIKIITENYLSHLTNITTVWMNKETIRIAINWVRKGILQLNWINLSN